MQVSVQIGLKLTGLELSLAITCDAKNISIRDRTVIAASVVNALGIDIEKTDTSQSSSWRAAKQARTEKAKEIKENFECPEKVVVHWDGKTMTLRGGVESKRVCIYLSGVDKERTRKLLGIPETESGKGVDEFEVVKKHLKKWGVKDQVVGMVFDTTASNTGAQCTFWCL